MKVLVIGATGRTGSEIVKQLLEEGNDVIAYVRRPESIQEKDHLSVVVGQINDSETMTKAAKGADAILVALGNPMSNSSAPLMEKAAPTVIKVSKASGVNRVIWLSALGVGKTLENTRYPYKLGAKTFLKGNFKDHHIGESQLEDSGLNWTTVHPGPLYNKEKTKNPIVKDASTGYIMPGSPRTNRADVAAVMIKIIHDDATFKKQILITSVGQKK